MTEREALAAKEGLVKFQPFIEGEKVLLITDHSALQWARTYENSNRRLAAWGAVFSAYMPNLEIIHRAGRVHSNVDPLSCLPRAPPDHISPPHDKELTIKTDFSLAEKQERQADMAPARTDFAVWSLRHLLDLPISRNMKFVMATGISDLKTFKPAEAPELSELTKRTYETGFQEEHLKDINGGTAFRDQYMGKLADILRRPQARALISMGGPSAWIAKRYGGPNIVQRFMEGPSTQVTVHHRGAVTSSPFYDDPMFYDQISAQEENLVHGYVPAENPEHHRWLFPTMDIMEDYCNHWQGEWTQGCDFIFHNIARSLERGTAKPLTRKGWKAYLHSTNHGTRRPDIVLTAAHFTRTEELLRGFSSAWHGKRIADIVFLMPFVPLDGN